jgi:hypothetical protein
LSSRSTIESRSSCLSRRDKTFAETRPGNCRCSSANRSVRARPRNQTICTSHLRAKKLRMGSIEQPVRPPRGFGNWSLAILHLPQGNFCSSDDLSASQCREPNLKCRFRTRKSDDYGKATMNPIPGGTDQVCARLNYRSWSQTAARATTCTVNQRSRGSTKRNWIASDRLYGSERDPSGYPVADARVRGETPRGAGYAKALDIGAAANSTADQGGRYANRAAPAWKNAAFSD